MTLLSNAVSINASPILELQPASEDLHSPLLWHIFNRLGQHFRLRSFASLWGYSLNAHDLYTRLHVKFGCRWGMLLDVSFRRILHFHFLDNLGQSSVVCVESLIACR